MLLSRNSDIILTIDNVAWDKDSKEYLGAHIEKLFSNIPSIKKHDILVVI